MGSADSRSRGRDNGTAGYKSERKQDGVELHAERSGLGKITVSWAGFQTVGAWILYLPRRLGSFHLELSEEAMISKMTYVPEIDSDEHVDRQKMCLRFTSVVGLLLY
jgi:hypothetical protein